MAVDQRYVLEPLAGLEESVGPIAAYGVRASELIMSSIRQVPQAERSLAIRMLLDKLDPSLYEAVAAEAQANQGKGMAPRPAMQAALATKLSAGMAAELVKVGRAALAGRAPTSTSLEALGFCGPICLAKKAGSAIAGGSKTAAGWASSIGSTLGSVACTAVNNPMASTVAGGAALAAGAPPQAGTAGIGVAQQICGKNQTPTLPQASLYAPATPPWVIPAAIGAGVLVIVLAMR